MAGEAAADSLCTETNGAIKGGNGYLLLRRRISEASANNLRRLSHSVIAANCFKSPTTTDKEL